MRTEAKRATPSNRPTFADQYIQFASNNKTVHEVCSHIGEIALKYGYTRHTNQRTDGARKISVQFNKRSGALFYLGNIERLREGLKIIGTHVDSPRLDLKPDPLNAKYDIATLQTRYYGGIKKYHWVGIPLELHGNGYRASGEEFRILMGRQPSDPVFTITDLAPHLSGEIDGASGSHSSISGERLNLVAGHTRSAATSRRDSFEEKLLSHLNLERGDFATGEFQAVPALQARYVGLDKNLIGAYGHDNRSCTYSAIMAFLDSQDSMENRAFIYCDKEEIGSQGVHGADSNILERFLLDIFSDIGLADYFQLRECIFNSVMISADVNVGIDPSWPEPTDDKNCGKLGAGVCLTKYTGSGGKRMASEADSSLVSQMRGLLEQRNLPWQPGELGKVDRGGGGTIAKHFARQGVQVFDLGPPVLGMHSPFEIIAVDDLWTSYLAYRTFFEHFQIKNPLS